MKIRSGFVSNSSSSSFVIFSKGDMSKDKLKKILLGDAKLDPNCVLYPIINSIVDVIVKEALQQSKSAISSDFDDWAGYKKALSLGCDTVYDSCFSDEDSAIEALICELGIDASGEDFVLYKHEKY